MQIFEISLHLYSWKLVTYNFVVASILLMNICFEEHSVHCLVVFVVHDVYLLQKVNIFLLETYLIFVSDGYA